MSDFQSIFGTTPLVSFFITLILGGGCALMTGRALALNWRPQWQLIIYCLLLGMADRFLIYALFQGEIFLPSGFVCDSLVLMVIGFVTFRITRASQMVRQYPWAYESAGFFGWRAKR